MLLSNLMWKGKNKMKGELLLTKMRYEIEGLNRQINLLQEEKGHMTKETELKIKEIQKNHENGSFLYFFKTHNQNSFKYSKKKTNRIDLQQRRSCQTK